MVYLTLFLTFLEIGAVSFGGGYGMISLIREKTFEYGWLTEEQLLNMIAVAESTPGPIAVNIATFVGSSQGGILGAFLATLGVVLPSFIIILIIAIFIRNLLKYKPVNAFLDGVRPVIVGLMIATAVIMMLNTMFGFKTVGNVFELDVTSIIIFAIIVLVAYLYKKLFKKKMSPILIIIIAAGLGMGICSLI